MAEAAECALAAAEHLEICLRNLSNQIEQVRVTYSTANLAVLVDPAFDPFTASQPAKQDLKTVHNLLLSADSIARDSAQSTPDMWEATVIVRNAIARVVLGADAIVGYLSLAGSMLRAISKTEDARSKPGDPSSQA